MLDPSNVRLQANLAKSGLKPDTTNYTREVRLKPDTTNTQNERPSKRVRPAYVPGGLSSVDLSQVSMAAWSGRRRKWVRSAMPDPTIFVSYARSDGFELGRALSERLTRDHGFSVWRDLANLEGGSDWWRQITEAIDRVEYLVLVMTPAALSSRAVRDEWRYARQRGVCVVPVVGVAALDFSGLPEWMRRTHFVDPREPEQWIRFVRTLECPCRTTRVPMMAGPPPDDYVTRSHEFTALQSHLAGDARGGSVAIAAALKGAGGYGKTTLARALCHDDLIRETYYDGVLWVTLGEQPGDPAAQLEDLIVTLTGTASKLTSAESRQQRLNEVLSDRSVLIVIDDVWNGAHLQPFLVGGDRCARLITTRDSQTLPPRTLEVRVDAMHRDEAISLLGAGVAGADRQSLASLASHLGEWPLLLKLVNRMLRDRIDRAGDGAPGAIAHVTRLLEKRGYRAFDARDPLQRHDAATATLAASVQRLTGDERARLKDLVIFRRTSTSRSKRWRCCGAALAASTSWTPRRAREPSSASRSCSTSIWRGAESGFTMSFDATWPTTSAPTSRAGFTANS